MVLVDKYAPGFLHHNSENIVYYFTGRQKFLQMLGKVSGKWPNLFKTATHELHTANLLLLAGKNSTTEPLMLQYKCENI